MIDEDDFTPEIVEDDGQEPAPGEPDSAADPKRVKRQQRRSSREKREGDEFWRGVFSTDVGRREMWRILVAAGYRSERFGATATGFPDPNATWFRAGIQSVSRHLFDEWQALDYEGVYLMLVENDPKFAKAKLPRKRGVA